MKSAVSDLSGDGNSSDNNGNSGLITSIDEIRAFNERIIEVTKHLSICIGSVLKVDSSFYANWGIGLTDENREELRQLSAFYYDKDYKERRRNGEIEHVLRTEFKQLHEWRMAEYIAITVKEIISSMDDGQRQFNVCDVPSREGQLSAAIAHALYRDNETREILSRTTFHIVDLSGEKLDKAEETLAQFGAKTHKYTANDEELFDRLTKAPTRLFDVIFSLSHFHHKSFLVDFLKKTELVLAERGALLIGDWHSPLCSHPYHIQQLLTNIGIDPQRQDQFREIMQERLSANRDKLHDEEMSAMMDHMLHWKNIYRKVSRGTLTIKPRLYVNGAYDTSRRRIEKLDEAGFSVDLEKIRMAFPKAKLPSFTKPGVAAKRLVRGSDAAVVMAAIKK